MLKLGLLVTSLLRAQSDTLSDAWGTSTRNEVLGEESLVVGGGVLPHWVKGDYFLNSASVFEEPKRNLTHLFDGFAKVLRWRFPGDGTATLRARLVQSNWLSQSDAKKDFVPSATIGRHRPPLTAAQKLSGPWGHCNDNFNVNVHSFGVSAPRVLLSDVSDPRASFVRIDPNSLLTQGQVWTDKWAHPISDRIAPAHPRIVPDGMGDTVGLIVRLDPAAVAGVGHHTLIIYRSNASSSPLQRAVLHEIKVKALPYVHSIGITKRYAIIVAAPLHWSVTKLLEGEPAGESFTWNDAASSDVYLVPLDPSQPVVSYTQRIPSSASTTSMPGRKVKMRLHSLL